MPNIIFIALDDANSWTIGYNLNARTPNLDELARNGQDCHCPAPMCNGSRTATLTGWQPYHSGVYTNTDYPFRDHLPEVVTLPQYFLQNGYRTCGVGKVFHGISEEWGVSWSDLAPESVLFTNKPIPENLPEFPWATIDAPLTDWGDMLRVDWVGDLLQQNHTTPFFVGLGLQTTHTPYYVPKPFANIYASVAYPQVLSSDRADIPPIPTTWLNWRIDGAKFDDVAAAGQWQNQLRHYLASISFMDWLIGRLMAYLSASAYADNTIVVIWADHGYHHGQKQFCGKYTLYDESTRVPLIFWGAGTDGLVQQSGPVGLIDLYPTLCDLAGLPIPAGLDGQTLTAQRQGPVICTHQMGNYAVIDREWKLNHYSDGTEELFHRILDPLEWKNRINGGFGLEESELRGWLPVVPYLSQTSACHNDIRG